MSRKIFISYRRSDTADFTVALYNELRDYFHDEDIFKDINAILPGQQFAQVLSNALDECAVVLVVIGPRWKGQDSNRLMEEGDWVRQEIGVALKRNLRVVPLLVNGTQMPQKQDLPVDLHPLLDRQAIPIDNQRFEYDVQQLCKAIKDLVPSRALEQPIRSQSSPWDNAFKAVLLLFMLASIALICWAWIGSHTDFKEKVFMSLLGVGGIAGGWAAFTRQRWIELRADQLERK